MKKRKHLSWHAYFMSVAIVSSLRSKDDTTQNGACVVKDNRIISSGYNGLPKGCSDDTRYFWSDNDRDIISGKDTYVVHAELNSILNGNRDELKGAVLYTTQYPCNICSQVIAQSGITSIMYINKKESDKHISINAASNNILKAAGVMVYSIDGLLNEDDNLYINSLLELKNIFE